MAGLPGFCSFASPSPGTGTISCSPGFDDAQAYPLTVTVTDNGSPNLTDSETFTLTDSNGARVAMRTFSIHAVSVAQGLDYDLDGDPIFLTGVAVDDPPNGGSVSFTGNEVTYVPGVNFVGIETLTYGISDGTAESTGTITVTVEDGMPDWAFIGLQSPWKAWL